ncbi:putative allantoate permease [Diplodia seriata]|uniref:Putative allantoate permease n=1 Tax=Diplodia seriata TaxID=420778 RepID=A0A0G2F180_9PEZI|nr:putative allantoate permease [Diplodia seriata]
METKTEKHSGTAAQQDAKPSPDDIGVAVIAEVGEVLDYTEEEERAVRWKIDLHLMPLLMITYLIQFLDKSCISYSALWGMRQDVGLHGSQYSWLTTIFYLGYLVAEFPLNYLFQRLHIARVCGVIIGLWGTVLLCMAAADDFAGLMTTRFFLGALEAGVSPCFVLLTSMFYKRSEQPLRTALWFSMNGLAQILGGPIAYGIGHITAASLPAWKFPFIIFGSLTVAWSALFFLLAPSSPSTSPFLTPRQRRIAILRLASNNTGGGTDTRVFKPHQAREALADPKCWLLIAFTVASNVPNGGVVAFGPLIVEGFGFGALGTTLLGMPSGGVQVLALVATGVVAGRFAGARVACMLGGIGVALAGTVMMYAIPERGDGGNDKYGRLVGYYLLPGFSATAYGRPDGGEHASRESVEQGLSDLTDMENPHFRYAL